jgi:hypothetical protein
MKMKFSSYHESPAQQKVKHGYTDKIDVFISKGITFPSEWQVRNDLRTIR